MRLLQTRFIKMATFQLWKEDTRVNWGTKMIKLWKEMTITHRLRIVSLASKPFTLINRTTRQLRPWTASNHTWWAVRFLNRHLTQVTTQMQVQMIAYIRGRILRGKVVASKKICKEVGSSNDSSRRRMVTILTQLWKARSTLIYQKTSIIKPVIVPELSMVGRVCQASNHSESLVEYCTKVLDSAS